MKNKTIVLNVDANIIWKECFALTLLKCDRVMQFWLCRGDTHLERSREKKIFKQMKKSSRKRKILKKSKVSVVLWLHRVDYGVPLTPWERDKGDLMSRDVFILPSGTVGWDKRRKLNKTFCVISIDSLLANQENSCYFTSHNVESFWSFLIGCVQTCPVSGRVSWHFMSEILLSTDD